MTAPGAAERIAERAGTPVDILVNNAGTARIAPFDELTEEDMYAAFELNVMAPLRLIRHFAPGMAGRGWGRIVNVTSTAGKRPSQTYPAYSVAKAAQHSLSRAAADFYAAQGVLVNTVAPGPTGTGLWREPGGLADQLARRNGTTIDDELAAQAGEGAAPPDRRAGRGRRRDRLPLLGARRVGHRRRLVGRRRRLAVDALGVSRDDGVAEADERRRGDVGDGGVAGHEDEAAGRRSDARTW